MAMIGTCLAPDRRRRGCAPGRGKAVHDRHLHVHQDEVEVAAARRPRPPGRRRLAVSIAMSNGSSTAQISSRLTSLSSTSSSRSGCSKAAGGVAISAVTPSTSPATGKVTSNQKVEPSPAHAVDADLAAQAANDAFADGQAQAGAAELARDRGVGLGEAAEDRIDLVRRRRRCRCRANRDAQPSVAPSARALTAPGSRRRPGR